VAQEDIGVNGVRLLLAALCLAGCARGVPVENEASVSGARFEAVQGEARLVVRTFLPVEGNSRREVLGARCDLRTSLYSLSFTTPVRLKLPNFGPQSPELDIACSAREWTGRARVAIRTDWDYPPGGYGYAGYGYHGPLGYSGGPYGGWGWPGPRPAVPRSYYPDVNLMLR
jgi:hypothetical protein